MAMIQLKSTCHLKNQKNHHWNEKRQSSKMNQMLELAHKAFKVAVIKIPQQSIAILLT